MNFDRDAFSDGQIGSKLWLCETLENLDVLRGRELVIWTLGGWYGVLAFLLLSRDRLSISRIRSFDIDSSAEEIADSLNNHWEIDNWKFKAHTVDVNNLNFNEFQGKPDVVINTSCEHFACDDWYKRIPEDTVVVLQATNMDIPDHISRVTSLENMKNRFPLKKTFFAGNKEFCYPDKSFSRYMLIGSL